MPRPKTHRFFVDITDMTGKIGERRLRNVIAASIKLSVARCLFYHDESHLANIQVKSARRVVAGHQTRITHLEKGKDSPS